MEFERRKAETLASLVAPWPDKSPKGSVDAPIAPLLDVINHHPSFFTTSSCSGRISILRQPSEGLNHTYNEGKTDNKKSKKKAGGGGWVFVSHEAADPETVVDLLFRQPRAVPGVLEGTEGDNLVFRFEPLIVALECKDAAAAQELVATALACGFRESGISSMRKRIMVSIRCSIRLELPLGQVGLIMVSPEYVRYLVGVANEKMEANRRKADGFLHTFREKVLPGSAKKFIHSARTAQACMTEERGLLGFQAKRRNMLPYKSQLEQGKKMQSDNQDSNILCSADDEEMSGMHKLSLSILTLTIVGEPIEKLFLWGHSASPLINKGMKEVIIFGGFGGIGHHSRRNNTLLLDTQSGRLKQIDSIGSPSPLVGHTSTTLEDIVYVIGGRGGPMHVFNDVWALNTTENRWILIECTGHTFHPRHRHATAAVGSNIYVFGGVNNETILSCMNVLNTETFVWSTVRTIGEWPCARHSHSLVSYGPLLLMFGGYDGQNALGDLYSFDTRTSLWRKVKTTGSFPAPRFSHSMFLYKNFVGIIGGCPLTQHFEVLALLNLHDNRWINLPINTVGRNLWVRCSTSVIGDEVVIVGGGASCYAFGTKFCYPAKMSLKLIILMDKFSSQVKEQSVTYYAIRHNFSQLNGGRSDVHSSYFDVDASGNQHGYQPDAMHRTLQIQKKYGKLVKDVLKKFGWLDLTKKVYHSNDGLHICLPISTKFYGMYKKETASFRDRFNNLNEESVLLKEFSIKNVSIPMALDILSLCNVSLIVSDVSYDKKIRSTQNVMRDMVYSLLMEKGFPLEMLDHLPMRWERLGDIVVLPVTSFSDPRWDSIADKLWPLVAKSLGALRLARQGRILPIGTRDSTLEILVGDNGWVTHQENGILYSFDATKCMFSSGNHSEKLRMACLDCRDEVIVDLFAGIGYFVLPFLLKAKAKLVYACEWNLQAIKALQHNIHANSVADRCIILEGDNRVTAPRGVADRVCLGLLPSSESSWKTAVRALRTQGGFLHIHGNVKDSDEKSWPEYIIKSIGGIAESEGLCWDISVQHVERVKSYGPHIRHLVADVRCKDR